MAATDSSAASIEGLYSIQEQRETASKQKNTYLGKCHFPAATTTVILLQPHLQLETWTPLMLQGHECHHPWTSSLHAPAGWGLSARTQGLCVRAEVYLCEPFFVLLTTRSERGIWTADEVLPSLPTGAPEAFVTNKPQLLALSKKSSSVLLKVPTGSRLALGFFVKR